MDRCRRGLIEGRGESILKGRQRLLLLPPKTTQSAPFAGHACLWEGYPNVNGLRRSSVLRRLANAIQGKIIGDLGLDFLCGHNISIAVRIAFFKPGHAAAIQRAGHFRLNLQRGIVILNR